MTKEYNYETIEVIKETIRVNQVCWNPDQIYELLKEIQSEKTFKGFVKIHFEVGELPEIVIYRKISKGNK